MRGQAYVGGKAITNMAGKVADFLYGNVLTRNSALVEIKTLAELLLGPEYRGGICPPGSGLTGAVTQVLTHAQELREKIAQLQREARLRGEPDAFEAFRPKAVVIAGTVAGQLDTGERVRSFELYRNASTDVEIVTFDEVARKVENLLSLLVAA